MVAVTNPNPEPFMSSLSRILAPALWCLGFFTACFTLPLVLMFAAANHPDAFAVLVGGYAFATVAVVVAEWVAE